MTLTGSGQDVIFANMTNQIQILNTLEDIVAEDTSSSEEEEAGTPIPKHETGKTDLRLKQVIKFIKHEKAEYRIVLCPQAPLIGNLRRKASFFPRLSKSHLTNTEIAFIVYSLDDLKSFSSAEDLLMQMEDLTSNAGTGKVCPMTLLVANAPKSLLKRRVVTAERGMKCAEKYGCIGFFEVDPMEISESDRVMKVIMEHVHEHYSKMKSKSEMTEEKKKDEGKSRKAKPSNSSSGSSEKDSEVAESAPTLDRHRRNNTSSENGGGDTCCIIS